MSAGSVKSGKQTGKVQLATYVAALTVVAAMLASSWVYREGLELDRRLVIGAAVFAGFILLGDLLSLRINEQFTVGAWDIGLIGAVVVLGPTWAALATLPSAFVVGGRDPLRTVYETSHSIILAFLAGIVFSFASGPLLLANPEFSTPILYGTLVAGMTLLTANEAINSFLMKVKYDQSFYETWKESWQPYLFSDFVNVLTAGLGVSVLLSYGQLAAVIVVAGSIGSQALVYRSREQVKQNRELRTRMESLEEALATSNMAFGTMIIRDLGQRDGYTHRHAAATATYAADLAREMKLDDTHIERLRMAGLLHNIGLFGLPDDMLLATGRPNSIAKSRLDEHPVRGEEALASVSEFEEMAAWVRWHHERPDGRGYPDKLRGPWIPLEARILSVAQAYAAMILDQPRRPGMKPAEAREQLSAGIDTAFDGVVVRALLRLLDTESEGYRMADDLRFVFPSLEGGARPGASDPRRDEDLGRTVPR